jgi:hypothetical protein
MANSSRQNALFGVNDWKAIYQTYNSADFQSYNYETLRKAFVDYLRVNYPETFNDYTESSEFIALLDVIAFMGQGLAFRNDLNTRENFIDTAERRDSVIKLANLVSYTPKRNLTSEGFLKVTRLQTTEDLYDLNGLNLSNNIILWNDPANTNWLEQFNIIFNATLVDTQRVGKPGNTQTIQEVKTDEYTININTTALPVVPFNSVVDGLTMKFELVSVTSVGKTALYEKAPQPTGQFNMLYRNDKLGYGSPNTGFFFYFKQGTLQTYDFTLNQEITNRVVDISNIEGINNTDTWLYKLNSDGTRTQWTQVDSVYATTSLVNTSSTRTVYSVISRFNDQVSYSFGDGVFSKIPLGNFRAYIRSGNALSYTINPSEMQGITVTLNYVSRKGSIETLTIGLELQSDVSNSAQRESLADIKLRAPTRYYTQNRMVNGEDYQNFPYTLYSSIIKSKALNRASVGVSRNLDLLDPTLKYSSVVGFGNDGALYQDSTDISLQLTINSVNDIIKFLTDTLSVTLAGSGPKQYYTQKLYPGYNTGAYTIYWNKSTTLSNSVTGYFYQVASNINLPMAVGTYSTINLKYVTTGALVQFTSPTGYYFDNNNYLTQDTSVSTKTTIWVAVTNVIGDGYNSGQGTFVNGSGPVTLSSYVPSTAVLTYIIPVFSNSLTSSVLQQCVVKMQLGQSFTLVFDPLLSINVDRWSLSTVNDSGYYVKFVATTSTNYSVSFRSLKYYFGSIADTRFFYDSNKTVYDPYSGAKQYDYIQILATNTLPNSNSALPNSYTLNIVGQPVRSDGYVNDFEIEISSLLSTNTDILINPEFFSVVTGYVSNTTNTKYYTFFKQVTDTNYITRYSIIATSSVVYAYATKNDIELVKYDYPVGQLFYAYSTGLFYVTVNSQTVTGALNYTVTQQASTLYIAKTGRQKINFQYRHVSDNTRRIDPATTNIIDLYVVTQSYYTNYTNYLQDTTGTISEPDKPTMTELRNSYSSLLNDYKMMSDSVILNSVTFKPLFGSKASTELQATVKIVKNVNISASDSEIRSAVLAVMNNYFDINNWNFGDTFFFSELSAYIHAELGQYVNSVVLVPTDTTLKFGNLYEIRCKPYEIFVNGAASTDIVIVSSLTASELQI